MKRLSIILVLVGALAACSGSADDVVMTDELAFEPAAITVEAGTTLTFSNDSDQPHTVTAYSDGVPEGGFFSSGGFDSEADARDGISQALVDPGETYEVTLGESGTLRYFCIPHEDQGMRGTIRVE